MGRNLDCHRCGVLRLQGLVRALRTSTYGRVLFLGQTRSAVLFSYGFECMIRTGCFMVSRLGGELVSTGQIEVPGGVSWLISWPRKKPIKT
jgi:hypothetical protein